MTMELWRTRRRSLQRGQRQGPLWGALRQAFRITLWQRLMSSKGPCNLPATGLSGQLLYRPVLAQPTHQCHHTHFFFPHHHFQPQCKQKASALLLQFWIHSPSPLPQISCRTSNVGQMGSWRTHVVGFRDGERAGELSCLACPGRPPSQEHATQSTQRQRGTTKLQENSVLTPPATLGLSENDAIWESIHRPRPLQRPAPVNVLILATPSLQ